MVLTNAEIGEQLYVSLGTVKAHIASIQRRLVIRNSDGAARRPHPLRHT